MDLSGELLFFFSALGAFNGLMLGLYFLFFAKPKHISNRFLGALLLVLSIRIGKSVFFHFNPDLAGGFVQIGLAACTLIGPFCYFYLKSLVRPNWGHGHEWKIHLLILLPPVFYYSINYPFWGHLELWRCYLLRVIYYLWLGYLLVSAWILKDVFRNFFNRQDKFNSVEFWAISIFLGNVIIWAAFFFSFYGSYILGALSFSFLFYISILYFIFNKKRKTILFQSPPKYAEKKIESNEADLLLDNLKQLFSDEQIFKNSNLKLPQLADRLKISPHKLSQLLNDNLGKSFPQFINAYRIEAAKKMIETNKEFSLEGIGYECGFNSKSTFFSTFKKLTGITPAAYKSGLNL